MTGISLWLYVFFAGAVAMAILWRAWRILRACRSGKGTPAAHPRPPFGDRCGTDLRTFFQKRWAAVLHTVLVVSFLGMCVDALWYPLGAGGEVYRIFSAGNAALAAAAIAAAAGLLARRVRPIARYRSLSPAQRRDGFAVLILEMVSAATLLAVYAGWQQGVWWHYGILLVFALYITFSKHLHIFLAPVYLAVFGRRETFSPDDMPEVAHELDVLEGRAPASETPPEGMGACRASDFTRGRLLSAFSCTECGRCESVCPVVAASDVPFSPRKVVADVRRAAMGKAEGALYGKAITRDEAFACISCGACLEACPIAISPMDLLLQVRRYAVLEQGELPPEEARVAESIVATGNPWAMETAGEEGSEERIPLADPKHPTEYLLWRGSMGIHDPQGRAVVRAAARMLDAAGVSWSALPPEEECDVADLLRYQGDEWTFLTAARSNIECLHRYGVRKIITPCPHSLSVLRDQYPSLGGRFTVQHLSEFVLQALRDGRLELPRTLEGQTVVYHDPCRLSRAHIVEAPREVLRALGARVVEAPQAGRGSMCCGGSGYFREGEVPAAIAARRMEQLASTGAQRVITACPYCYQMLSLASGEKALPVSDLTQWLRV